MSRKIVIGIMALAAIGSASAATASQIKEERRAVLRGRTMVWQPNSPRVIVAKKSDPSKSREYAKRIRRNHGG